MESRMGQAWARWSVLEGQWPHRSAPLRSSGCVSFVVETRMLGSTSRHERLRALSADFRFGGTVAGGERDLEDPGAGKRGGGGGFPAPPPGETTPRNHRPPNLLR